MLVVAAWPELSALAGRMLTSAELNRSAAFLDPADRLDFRAAHVLVRLLAGRLLHVPPAGLELTQHCDRCGGSHGRPGFAAHPGLQVSLSHTKGAVLAAAAFSPVGADIENLSRPHVDAELADLVLSTDEQQTLRQATDRNAAFLRHWVRKEAMIKMGYGSLDDLRQLDFGGRPASDRHDRFPVRTPLEPTWPGLQLLERMDRDAGLVYAIISAEPVVLMPASTVLTTG